MQAYIARARSESEHILCTEIFWIKSNSSPNQIENDTYKKKISKFSYVFFCCCFWFCNPFCLISHIPNQYNARPEQQKEMWMWKVEHFSPHTHTKYNIFYLIILVHPSNTIYSFTHTHTHSLKPNTHELTRSTEKL